MKTKRMRRILPVLMLVALLCATTLPVFAAGKTPSVSPKEEVVYVNIAADGTVETVYVVNIFKGGDILDYGNYSEIRNLNTQDQISQNGDEITFSSSADRVYYQGKLNTTVIPWNISIKYFIDDVEYPATEIAGKSGKLKIRFSVTENENAGGDFFATYALQASITLDAHRCADIAAPGATIVNVGGDKQITYTILPGKGIDTEITADVTNFEMGAIALNGIPLSLDITVDYDELLDEVRELLDAIAELDDGASDLLDGAGELKNGASDLKDGASELDDGSDELRQGAADLKDGVDDLYDGTADCKDGAQGLVDGAGQLKDGSVALKDGISDAMDGASELEDALTEISANSDGLRTGAYQVFASLTASAEAQLNASLRAAGLEPVTLTPETYTDVLDELVLTLSEYAYMQAEAAARAEIRAQVEAEYEAVIRAQVESAVRAQIRTAITEDTTAMAEIEAGVEATYGSEIHTLAQNSIALEVANQYCPEDPEGWLATAEGQSAVAAYLASTEGQAAYVTVREQIKEQYVSAAVDAQVEAQMGTEEVQNVIDQNAEAQMASDEIQGQIAATTETLLADEAIQEQIAQGAQSGLTGNDAYQGVIALREQLDSYNAFYAGLHLYTQSVDLAAEGATELKNGMSELVAGASELAEGASELYDGCMELQDGTVALLDGVAALKDGVAELYDGCTTLKDGSAELLDGATELYEGSAELYDGCVELRDGTAEMRTETDGMDTEIQDKVDEMIREITGGDRTITSFVSEKNTDVLSVQFVMQTEAIEIPETGSANVTGPAKLNFWQKLLKLFGLYREN